MIDNNRLLKAFISLCLSSHWDRLEKCDEKVMMTIEKDMVLRLEGEFAYSKKAIREMTSLCFNIRQEILKNDFELFEKINEEDEENETISKFLCVSRTNKMKCAVLLLKKKESLLQEDKSRIPEKWRKEVWKYQEKYSLNYQSIQGIIFVITSSSNQGTDLSYVFILRDSLKVKNAPQKINKKGLLSPITKNCTMIRDDIKKKEIANHYSLSVVKEVLYFKNQILTKFFLKDVSFCDYEFLAHESFLKEFALQDGGRKLQNLVSFVVLNYLFRWSQCSQTILAKTHHSGISYFVNPNNQQSFFEHIITALFEFLQNYLQEHRNYFLSQKCFRYFQDSASRASINDLIILLGGPFHSHVNTLPNPIRKDSKFEKLSSTELIRLQRNSQIEVKVAVLMFFCLIIWDYYTNQMKTFSQLNLGNETLLESICKKLRFMYRDNFPQIPVISLL
jgi:hypothetical protein